MLVSKLEYVWNLQKLKTKITSRVLDFFELGFYYFYLPKNLNKAHCGMSS